jgi:transposase
MPVVVPKPELSSTDRAEIERWLDAHGTPQQVALRGRIILSSADGKGDSVVARELGVNCKTVTLWRERVIAEGIESLWEIAPGRGRKPKYGAGKIEAIVRATLHSKPKGMTHWSCRTMADRQGVSKATVNRIWISHGLKPHLSETFKLSRDTRFLEKLTDVVGLYLNPPHKALVLCVDEKSQIQALDRTQPGLPMKKGRCGTMTHDYKRNGTTTLFAALEVLHGRVVGQCFQRHRHQEFLRFLRRLDEEFPAPTPLHLVLDNYGTHKHPKVKAWFERHPRFVAHFIPTSSSWLNMVERWFAHLSIKAIRRASFPSTPDLKRAIAAFLEAWNDNPRPFVWTATVDQICAKLSRCRQTLEQILPGCTKPPTRKRRAKTSS